MASASSDSQVDTTCSKCGAPASWADSSTSNLSWQQSLKQHLENYMKSPRMWPIGYICQSSYSPFRLEVDMPDHKSWRDAFEDLLALESGGQMISSKSRQKEAGVAKRIWENVISRHVSIVNDQLRSDAKCIALLKRIRDVAARENFAPTLGVVAQAIPAKEESSKQTIAFAQDMITGLEQQMGKTWPASSYKMRGQWMASLVSSGALPGWRAQMFDSSDGSQVGLTKIEGDPADSDGLRMTEKELDEQFVEGLPSYVGSPAWSTDAGHYPEPEADGLNLRHLPLRPSILSQETSAECTKSDKGDIPTKVTLTNQLTDGQTEQKEIMDDSCKVLEENQKMYDSMKERNAAVAIATQEAQIDMMASHFKGLEEVVELD